MNHPHTLKKITIPKINRALMPLLLASLLGSGLHTLRAEAPKGQQAYDVAAFVWPSYHPDDRAKIFWPQGIGEWETVMTNRAKFEGHEQPRFPLWGYINEADPYVAEMEIDAAADHGVNVFIFDWYWYDGMPFLEGQLNDGFLKARNNDRMKFYLMWANHDVTLGWDKRNADDAFSKKNEALVWKGDVDREEFEEALRRAKAFLDARPDQAPLVTINSWNEWTETSYLMPCTMHGYGYLEAVKRVFGSAEAKPAKQDK